MVGTIYLSGRTGFAQSSLRTQNDSCVNLLTNKKPRTRRGHKRMDGLVKKQYMWMLVLKL